MASLSNFLSRLDFFEGIDHTSLDTLAAFALVREVKANRILLNHGEAPSHLTFILDGKLQTQELSNDGRIIGRGTFVQGQVIGLLTLVDGLPLPHQIRAVEDAQLLLIPILTARQFIMGNHLLMARLLNLLAAAVRHHQNEKAILSLPNAYQRVFMQINLLSDQSTEGATTPLPKQHEIASTANTSRETVSRALQMLIKSGILTKLGHNIVINRGDALRKLAAEGPEALKRVTE